MEKLLSERGHDYGIAAKQHNSNLTSNSYE